LAEYSQLASLLLLRRSELSEKIELLVGQSLSNLARLLYSPTGRKTSENFH
jgi:hypothetical protein